MVDYKVGDWVERIGTVGKYQENEGMCKGCLYKVKQISGATVFFEGLHLGYGVDYFRLSKNYVISKILEEL